MNTIHLRIAAAFLDLAFVIVAAFALREIFPEGPAGGVTPPVIAGCFLGAAFLYGLCGGALRASPGKRLLGLDVAPVDGRSLGFLRAMLREQMRLVELVFFISGFFSFLNMLESRPTRTDILFRTCVRDRRR